MALELTEAQEQTLLKVIAAFDAGLRIIDLEAVGDDANPFDLFVETYDSTTGESRKASLASMLPYLEEDVSYGIQFDTSVSSPTCTRIGNSDLHKTLPIQSRMKGCLLDDDGNVVEYLNAADWTANVRDGSRGQVMVELPEFWWKFTTDGTVREVRMSMYPVPGYTYVPQMYVSAYEASVDRTNLLLCSVANTDEQYRGGNNNADYDDDEYKTFLGRPATSISRTNFQKYARNRGSVNWNSYLYRIHKELFWLFAVEYATLNSQAAYNSELTSEGYHQGGLGSGVTTLSSTQWSTFNGSYPFVPCGYTDEFGNGTGVKDYSFTADDDGTVLTVSAIRYRGVEHPFGHISKWTADVNIKVSPNEEDGGDGISQCYVCEDPNYFSDSGYDGYIMIGEVPRTTEQYITEVIFGEYGDIIAKAVGGSSTTYFCDRWYCAIPASAVTLYGLYVGGNANSGAAAGFACENTHHVPSNTYTGRGSRLCYVKAA